MAGLWDNPPPGKTFKAAAADVSFPEHVSFGGWTFGFSFSSEGGDRIVFACLNIVFGGRVRFEQGLNVLAFSSFSQHGSIPGCGQVAGRVAWWGEERPAQAVLTLAIMPLPSPGHHTQRVVLRRDDRHGLPTQHHPLGNSAISPGVLEKTAAGNRPCFSGKGNCHPLFL